jgi:hypothetical protein
MSDIYKPSGAIDLSELGASQIRLGIQGPPFAGKTTAALSFPNPVILSFDKKLNNFTDRKDIITIPFWNDSFIESIIPKVGIEAPVNRKDAILKWIYTEGSKLTTIQTLIIDGSSFIEEAYHSWYRFNEDELSIARNGYVEWNLKKSFFEELFNAFKTISCNLVYITHEVQDRDDKGRLNGKLRPLLAGQAGDKMAGNFTDWFRMKTGDKPTNNESRKKIIETCGIDEITLDEWITSVPKDYMSIHLFQTQGDEMFNGGSSSLFNPPKYILANYSVFNKYKRKIV